VSKKATGRNQGGTILVYVVLICENQKLFQVRSFKKRHFNIKQITPSKMGVTTIFDKALTTAIAQKEILLV
jgi:hypothetical protein